MPSANSANMNDLSIDYTYTSCSYIIYLLIASHSSVTNKCSQEHVYCLTNTLQIKSIYELLAIMPLSFSYDYSSLYISSSGPLNICQYMYLSSALQPFIYSQLLTSLPRQSSLFLISDLWCSRLDFRGDGSLISHTTTPGCMLFCIVYKNDKHPHLEYAKYHTSWPETQAIQFLNIVLACISWSSYRNIYWLNVIFFFTAWLILCHQ
jgi:hypothetical protein